MKLDLRDLRVRCEAAIADHMHVDVRVDELRALLDRLESARAAIDHAIRRVGTDAEFTYHMELTETLERLVLAYAKIENLPPKAVRDEITQRARALPQSRCAADRAFLDGGS